MRRRGFSFGRRPAAFPAVGTRFAERYQLEKRLGAGGGSAVFQALDTRLGRRVALKILAPDEMDAPGLARFGREAQSIARLSHPGIVILYDFDEYEGQPYLVLELVGGQDLWARLYEDERPLPPEDTLQITRSILEALDYAHAHDVIHRDLKPENVMVDEELHTKVTDFGLAYIRGQSRITQDGIISGSAFYIAPEVAENRPSDHRVDLYALGVMLYEMLTGRLPFYSDNPIAVIQQHVHEAPAPPTQFNPQISPALEAIILKLLAKRPEERFTSAKAVLNALDQAERGETIQDKPTPAALIQRINIERPTGREAEWRHLRGCWSQVSLGAAEARPLVVIAGEAGSGKTGFVQQFLNEARQTGVPVLTGVCYQNEAPLPYRPFIEILRDYLREHQPVLPPLMAADLSKLVPEIAGTYTVADLPALKPEAERLRLFEHVTQFFILAARAQPIVLCIEDLHWADTSTLALLHYLTRNIRRQRVMLLGTYRPTELDHRHPFDQLLRELAGQNLVETITLRRLSVEDIAHLVEAILGAGMDSSFSQTIYARTEGNLFFTRELLKSLVEDGHIYFDEAAGQWRHTRVDELELPGSIRSVIGQQLSKLSQPAHQMLETAAVIGREFAFDVLLAVMEADEEALTGLLDEALDADIVQERRAGRLENYVFENASTRESLLENLSQRHKARLHLKIARVLESNPRTQGQIESIARHYSLGARTDEDIQRAIEYLMRAAEQASNVFALSNAVDLYNQAYELLQEGEAQPEKLVSLREKRGMVYQQQGAFLAAAADLEFVLADSSTASDLSRQRHTLLQLGQVYRRSERFEDAIRALQSAVDIARQMNNPRFVASGLYYLGATYWSRRDIIQALAHQEEGYHIVTQLGLQDKVAMRVIHGLAECLMRRGDYPRMIPLAEQSLELARGMGDMEYQAENLMILAVSAVDMADYTRARTIIQECVSLAQRAGMRLHHTNGLTLLGWIEAATGDYQAGIGHMQSVLPTAREYFKATPLTMLYDMLGRSYLEVDALELAAESFDRCLEAARQQGVSWSEATHVGNWALARIGLGQTDMRPLLEETLTRIEAQGDVCYLPSLYRALAALELALDRPQQAAAWADTMRTLAAQLRRPEQVAGGYLWEGRALIMAGKPAEARVMLTEGLRIAENIPRPRLHWDLHAALMSITSGEEAESHRVAVRGILTRLLKSFKPGSPLRRRLQDTLDSL